jgi:CysZ protein
MFRAATLALAQLFDSRFIRVAGLSTMATMLLFVLLAVAAGWGTAALLGSVNVASLPHWLAGGWVWLDGLVATLGGFSFFIGLLFLFPAVATLVMGALLDDVVDAVEDRHYPARKAVRPTGMWRGAWLGLASGARMLLVNLLLLPVYLILLVTGIGPFLLYLLVNGYLLGRDYVQMVSVRHLDKTAERTHRKATRGSQFALGVLVSLLFLVPFVNLLAPLLGAAMATHIFHSTSAK